MATLSSILAWKIPWMEEPARLQSTRLQRVGRDWATSLSFFFSVPYLMCVFQLLVKLAAFFYFFSNNIFVLILWLFIVWLVGLFGTVIYKEEVPVEEGDVTDLMLFFLNSHCLSCAARVILLPANRAVYVILWIILYVPVPGEVLSSEGNGNPLQYSCLENPRDRGA